MEALQASGLDKDEALLIAIRRMGSSTVLAGELAIADLDRTWAQLPRAEEPGGGGYRREVGWVVLAAAAAADEVWVELMVAFSDCQTGPSHHIRASQLGA